MSFRLFERLFVFVLLLSSMGVVDSLTQPKSGIRIGPDASIAEQRSIKSNTVANNVPLTTKIIQSGLYAVGAILVLYRRRQVLSAVRPVWPLVAFAALAPLSIAWSVLPELTLRKSALVIGSTCIGVYLGAGLSIERLAKTLASAMCVMIAAVAGLYIFVPGRVTVAANSHALKGLSLSKNNFGAYMAIAVIVLLLVRFRRFRWMRIVFIVAAVAFLLLSRSASSLAVCVVVVGALPFWRLIQVSSNLRFLICIFALTILITCLYVVATNIGVILHLLGRDATLTGRIPLWSSVLAAIMKRPIQGYGYGAFWDVSNGEVQNLWQQVRWVFMGAHNGYLEVCLSFGLVGLAVLIYVLAGSLRMAFKYARSQPGMIGLWPISYMIFFLLHNLFESDLMTTRSLDFLLFTAITTSLALHRRRQESQLLVQNSVQWKGLEATRKVRPLKPRPFEHPSRASTYSSKIRSQRPRIRR